MTDETIGAFDPATDPDPEPGMPPRNVTPMQRPQPPGQASGQPPGTANMQPGGAVPAKYPIRVVTVTLPAPYDGFWVKGCPNLPTDYITNAQKLIADLPDPEEDGLDEGTAAARKETFDAEMAKYATRMSRFIIETNFVDTDDEPFPPTTDPEFWKKFVIYRELSQVTMQTLQGQVGVLDPPKKRR